MTGSATPQNASVAPPGNGRELLWLGLILLATFLVYSKALFNGFTYDDRFYASAYTMHGRNLMVVDDHPLSAYFEKPMGYGVQGRGRGFRPITVLSYAWTHKAVRSKIDPPRVHPGYPEERIEQEWTDPAWPHHLINLLLHVFATFVAYRLVRCFTGPGLSALGGAAVFGLHALHSDPVVSIVGRGELFPFVFGGVATLVYLRGIGCSGAAKWWRAVVVAVCMLAAFLSKESSVGWVGMAPVCAAVYYGMRGESIRASTRRQALVGFVAIVIPMIVFFVLRSRMMMTAPEAQDFQVGTGNNALFAMSLFERLPTAVMVWGFGLWKLLVPYPLASDYSREVFDVIGYADWRFYASGSVLLAILIGGLRGFHRQPLLFLGMAVCLGFGFIASNIPVPIETIFGERLLYTPSFGLCFLVAAILARSRRVFLVVLTVWLILSAAICVKRSIDWESNETLWAVDADTQSRSLGLQMNMARVCRLRGDWEGRRVYLERALAVDEYYYSALNDIAADMMSEGEYAGALPYLQKALGNLERKGGFDYEIYAQDILLNIGMAQQRLGKFEDGRRSIERSIEVPRARERKNSAYGAYMWLFWFAWQRGDVADLKKLLAEADPQFPDNVGLHVYRGILEFDAKNFARAAMILEKALPLLGPNPHSVFGYEALVGACRASGPCAKLAKHLVSQGRVLRAEGDFAAARKAFSAALADPAEALDAQKGLLWTAWEEGDPAAVQKILLGALQRAPQDPELHVHRGILAQQNGDAQTAVQILRQTALRMPPSRDKLRAFHAMGEALVQLQDFGEATKLFAAMLSDPNVPIDYKRKFTQLKARMERGGAN